jgi:DNA repair exonuclease SbcCD nuclease subunit
MRRRPVAIFADLHLHEHTAFAVDRDRFNSRLLDSRDIVRDIATACVAAGVRDVLFAGDWFHARRRVGVACLDVSESVLNECRRKHGLNIHAIPGNHDLSLDGRACSVVGQPFASVTTEHGAVQDVSGWRVCFVPWTDDSEVVKRALSVEADLYVGHFGVAGTKVGPSDYEMPGHVGLNSIIHRATEGAPLVLGHYHKPQNILDSQTLYVGSPLQQGWGETGEAKRFVIVTPNGGVKSVPLPNGPRFLRLRPDELDTARPIDFVEVVVDTVRQVRRARNLIADVRRDSQTSIVLREVPKADAPVLDIAGLKIRTQLRRYVDHTGVPEGVDRKSLIQAGLELLGDTE